jgi:hypothetical protein
VITPPPARAAVLRCEALPAGAHRHSINFVNAAPLHPLKRRGSPDPSEEIDWQ